MNVLEQLKAMGFEEKPLQFYDGGEGGGGDPSGGGDGPSGGMSAADGVGMSGFDSVGNFGAADSGGPSAADISAADAIATMGVNQLSGATLNEGIANALADVVSANIAQDWASSQGQFAKSALQGLAELGYGKMAGLNANNPTQTVDNLLASANTAWGIQNIVAPAITMAVPGASTAMALGKGIAGLASGQISIGQSVANTAISLAASQMGLPTGTFAAMVNGNLGQAAANTAVGALNSAISSLTGIPAGIVGLGMNISGAGQFANQAITGAVNQAAGITPTDNIAAIGKSIDAALGTAPGTTSGFGYSFDSAGQPAFDSVGASETPTAQPSPVSSASPASSSMGALGAIGALGALGFQEQETPEEYQTAQVPVTSPFGLMYGMRG